MTYSFLGFVVLIIIPIIVGFIGWLLFVRSSDDGVISVIFGWWILGLLIIIGTFCISVFIYIIFMVFDILGRLLFTGSLG